MFKALGITEEESKEKFGFLLKLSSTGLRRTEELLSGLTGLSCCLAETEQSQGMHRLPENRASQLLVDRGAISG